METAIMREFHLSLHEYSCLIATLRERLSIEHVHELAFLSSGSAPAYRPWASDARAQYPLLPQRMAQPVLVTRSL
jgi:hypothetical protein